MDNSDLYSKWLDAKRRESEAVAERRKIEDILIAHNEINENKDGSETFTDGLVKITVTTRINRKVDSDKLQEIAAENGLTPHLSDLFRWKPEIDIKRWKAADESITKTLSGAITAKPGRPSFSIKLIEE